MSKIHTLEIEIRPLVPTDATSHIQPTSAPVDFTDGAVKPDCLSNRLRNASWTQDYSEVPASAVSRGFEFEGQTATAVVRQPLFR